MLLEFIKSFSYENYYLFIAIIFCIYFSIKKHYESVCYIVGLQSFAHVCRTILKVIFQIPHPTFSHTYAFPSSEVIMEVVTVCSLFYFACKNRIILFSSFVLMCVYASWRVIYFGWHNLVDSIGGSVFAFVILMLYFLVLKKKLTLKQLLFFNFYFPFIVSVLLRPRSEMYITDNTYKAFVPCSFACLVCYITLYVIENWKDVKAKFMKIKQCFKHR